MAAAAAAAAAILFALPSTFCVCAVGDSLAANAFSVCNISTGFRGSGQSGRMDATSRCRALQRLRRGVYERARTGGPDAHDRKRNGGGLHVLRRWWNSHLRLGSDPEVAREERTASSNGHHVPGVLRKKRKIPRLASCVQHTSYYHYRIIIIIIIIIISTSNIIVRTHSRRVYGTTLYLFPSKTKYWLQLWWNIIIRYYNIKVRIIYYIRMEICTRKSVFGVNIIPLNRYINTLTICAGRRRQEKKIERGIHRVMVL